MKILNTNKIVRTPEKFDDNLALVSIKIKKSHSDEQRKMINNLLGITSRDNSKFASSKINNFDLSKLLKEEEIKKIFSQKSSSSLISSKFDQEIISLLERANNFIEFMDIVESNGLLVTLTDQKLLDVDFDNHKIKLIIKLQKSKNLFIAKWKKIKNKYLEIQTQTNNWPLYIGTFIIKLKMENSVIYAPLLLKKVEIDINNRNNVKIKTVDSSVELNEKLLFLLQTKYKFSLPKPLDDEDITFNEYIAETLYSLNDIIINNEVDLMGKFDFLKTNEIKNQGIEVAPGVILTISNPTGGVLREKLVNLLNDKKIEDILDFDEMENVKKKILDYMIGQKKIFRINQTDLSQEKAILGSLDDSAIIWGPPGTGKSQTISNIIANLILQNKNVLVTSEKKAALDIIKSRMGNLSKFIYFGLVDKKGKKEFYSSLKELLITIREHEYSFDESAGSPTFSDNQIEWFKIKNKINDVNWKFIKINNYLFEDSDKLEIIIKFLKKLRQQDSFNKIQNSTSLKQLNNKQYLPYKFIFFKSSELRLSIKILNNLENDFNKFKNLIQIGVKEIEIMENYKDMFDLYKKQENINNLKLTDNEKLEKYIVNNFMHKINIINEIGGKKQLKSFWKSIESGWMLPHKFVFKHKNIIDKLFNVFVSTPNALANAINWNSYWDYAIFDEASQMHLEKAIPFLELANRSIIAGDHEQMQPTSYFQIRDESDSREKTELSAKSLLDFAYRKGLGSREFMLTKNYRSSSSDLMLFSSNEFYKSNLDVLDKVNNFEPAIEVIEAFGIWEKQVNFKEINIMLEKTISIIDKYNTIILLTLNSKQKQILESVIYEDIDSYKKIIDRLESGSIKLRNLENIQGDEADIVIISVAYDKNAKLGSTYIAKPEGRNSLNVAISRAKEKMIIIKSISSSDFSGSNTNKSINTFKKWLSYLENDIKTKNISVDSNFKNAIFDSGFEEEVYIELSKIKLSKKFYLETQFNVGSYKIDIAFINPKTKNFVLGIEVDGAKYHSGYEKRMKDFERQSFLESKGYAIHRIEEIYWNINKGREIISIKKLLKSM